MSDSPPLPPLIRTTSPTRLPGPGRARRSRSPRSRRRSPSLPPLIRTTSPTRLPGVRGSGRRRRSVSPAPSIAPTFIGETPPPDFRFLQRQRERLLRFLTAARDIADTNQQPAQHTYTDPNDGRTISIIVYPAPTSTNVPRTTPPRRTRTGGTMPRQLFL